MRRSAGGACCAVMPHTGNISNRPARRAEPAGIDSEVRGIEEAAETWRQTKPHVKGHGVDPSKERALLGPRLKFDPDRERFTGEHADNANTLIREGDRAPFEIRDEV